MTDEPQPGRGRRILVVDDTTANLQLLTRLLMDHGYLVSPASDGELALEFVQVTLPDLILLDVRMPRMDGFEVCRRLKADPRTRAVPVILVSVLEDEPAKVKGFREGAVDYVTKPFQPEEVLARVALHLQVRELTERLEQKVAERTEELQRTNGQLQREIAERTLTEQALRASEEQVRRQYSTLHCIIDSLNAPIFSLDRAYRYTSFNQSHAETMKVLYRADIELGHSMLDYVTVPDDRSTARSNLDRALAGERHVQEAYSGEEPRSRRYFQVSHSPIRTEGDDIIGVTVLAQDITERKRTEDEIRELNQDLERRVRDRTRQLEASKEERDQAFRELQLAHARIVQQEKMASIGQLAAGIAHEINTPTQYLSDNLAFLELALPQVVQTLSARRGMQAAGSGENPARPAPPSGTAPRGEDPGPGQATPGRLPDGDVTFFIEEVPRALRESRAGVQRITRIISAMKDFAYRGSGQPERIDLPHLISDAVEMSRNEWSAVGEVDLAIGPETSSLTCLPDQLGQVILNLVVNAAHAIADARRPPGTGRIRISTDRDGDWIAIRIQDNGCGIPHELQERVFEPFFTTKPPGRGTGQGLAIAHDVVVNTHGGDIRVESGPGAGATVTVRLPVHGPAGRTATPTPGGDRPPAATDRPRLTGRD